MAIGKIFSEELKATAFQRWREVQYRSERMDDGHHNDRLMAMHDRVGEWNGGDIIARYNACADALEAILEPPVDLFAMASDEYDEIMLAQKAMEEVGS